MPSALTHVVAAASIGTALVPGRRGIIALGALCAATTAFPEETFLTAVREALHAKCALIPVNEDAFRWGVRAVKGA